MSSWDGVSEFVAVAETESFTAAGKRLGVSTAHVSRQIGALETRLAVKLFYRTTRRVTITETGQIYYQHCRQVLDGLDEAERAIADLHQKPIGRLNLTAPVTYGECRIAPLVNDFAALYPELEVNVVLTNQLLDLVAENYDLAIRLGKLKDSTLIARQLASRTQYVCAAPDYLAAHGEPHTLPELERHNCLQGTLAYWRFLEDEAPRHIRVSGSIRYNSGLALVDAALKGIGVVQLPDYYVRAHLDSGRLLSILDRFRAPDEGIWAVYPHNRQLSSKVRLLIDYLRDGLCESPERSLHR